MHELSFGTRKWEFTSRAWNIVAILNALNDNAWQPVEEIPRWMPMKEQLRPATGAKSERGYYLTAPEIRDALSVWKAKTKGVLCWRLKGVGASWEPLA
jgi:hypothetical protein